MTTDPTFTDEICPLSIHCFREARHEGRCRDAGMTETGECLDPEWLRLAIGDNGEIVYGRCPKCRTWGELDVDQLHGRVSTHHDDPECGYHETKNWWKDHVA